MIEKAEAKSTCSMSISGISGGHSHDLGTENREASQLVIFRTCYQKRNTKDCQFLGSPRRIFLVVVGVVVLLVVRPLWKKPRVRFELHLAPSVYHKEQESDRISVC
ncbi:hypothetical protein BU24DRAFT_136217 [Aaosphaeria arxii CBS 175.79]|uniref:Uncharacterized protein n=1 Tax=Aaosphaeria arxii CBS 175.79 TaxID=1450172 RepID=A0A6A5Y3X5_9PLEO|nr:uncharacterized protein BU24DRAFT_136217 [Aaosphaeria arxii CBS 175.79]KAF2020275.1 hypothetical protein BU24DRAFT_136217 [Aaosphaeria arxii CBS 175.79]